MKVTAALATASRARQKWTRLAAHSILLASLVFLALALARLDPLAVLAGISMMEALAAAVAALTYAALLALLTMAWSGCAGGLPLRPAIATYGPGVIAKYVPGTVLQYASRQVLGARHGLASGPMVQASLVEAVLHLAAAMIVGAALLAGSVLAMAGVMLAGLAMLAWPAGVARAAGLQLLFFAAFGGIVTLLAYLAGIADPQGMAGQFMLAWLAGFLVPVAPGGVGVREAALFALAGSTGGEGAAVMTVALLVRLVTTAGDGLFGAAGCYLGRAEARSNRQASA